MGINADKFMGLKELVASVEDDYTKATAGNRAAATRVRKAMQQVKKYAQDIRVAVLPKE